MAQKDRIIGEYFRILPSMMRSSRGFFFRSITNDVTIRDMSRILQSTRSTRIMIYKKKR